MSGFTMEMDVSGLLRQIDEWDAAVEEAVRPSAQAGAQVVYNVVKANVNALGRKSGNLAASIYQVYSADNSGRRRAEYHVSWNNKKARHGHLIEYGYVQPYVVYVDRRGRWRTKVRPEMRGKPPPKGEGAKASYYVPLPGGPRLVAPKSFLRSARTPGINAKARRAMVDKFLEIFDMRIKGSRR